MGYITLYAVCHQCGWPFSSNPDLVPSLRLASGEQVVFCEPCVRAANPIRREKGLPEIPIRPGAYEPGPEHPAEGMLDQDY